MYLAPTPSSCRVIMAATKMIMSSSIYMIDVDDHVEIVLPERQFVQAQDLQIDDREAGGTDQLHQIDREGQQDDAAQRQPELLAMDRLFNLLQPSAAALPGLQLADPGSIGDIFPQVIKPGQQGHPADGDPDPNDKAHEDQKIEPGGHEQEVNEARGGDKGAAENPHLAPVFQTQQQVDEKDQDPHGARVEAVQQADDQGDQAQGQVLDLDLADQRQGQLLGDGLLFRGNQVGGTAHEAGHHVGGAGAPRLLDRVGDGRAGAVFSQPADEIALAHHREGHAGDIGPEFLAYFSK